MRTESQTETHKIEIEIEIVRRQRIVLAAIGAQLAGFQPSLVAADSANEGIH